MKLFDYLHPSGDSILKDTLGILSYCDTAKSYTESLSPQILILKGPVAQAFAPDKDNIYLRVPALQQKGRIEQALDLISAYIELKMNQDLPKLDPEKLNEESTLQSQHLKNVTILLKSFPIAQELEEHGYKSIKALRLMGLGKLYQAWKTGKSHEECVTLYWNDFIEGDEE